MLNTLYICLLATLYTDHHSNACAITSFEYSVSSRLSRVYFALILLNFQRVYSVFFKAHSAAKGAKTNVSVHFSLSL